MNRTTPALSEKFRLEEPWKISFFLQRDIFMRSRKYEKAAKKKKKRQHFVSLFTESSWAGGKKEKLGRPFSNLG